MRDGTLSSSAMPSATLSHSQHSASVEEGSREGVLGRRSSRVDLKYSLVVVIFSTLGRVRKSSQIPARDTCPGNLHNLPSSRVP